MNAKRVDAAAAVVRAAMAQGRKTPTGFVLALEAAGLLMSPEKAAELDALWKRVDAVERTYTFDTAELKREADVLRARVAELDKACDEVIGERDYMHDALDKLAYAIAPEEVIGEHSSDNDPWANAYELVTPVAEVDKLRARVAELKTGVLAEQRHWIDEDDTTFQTMPEATS